ncbi:bifunctional phosphoglucose/phosphomannose isomerase [Patescibacteria group bacterium]|nr:bifunctional phosphoglucose/phosphomannose isomerase [Patescibacteria group bacterium]
MMDQAIRDFPKQFEYEPVIENEDNLKRKKRFIVCGMGGSNLSAGLLKIVNPKLDIISHRNYGLPTIQGPSLDAPRTVLGFEEHLVIAGSYSGNTEETIDAFNAALEKGLALAAITTNGKLLELAKKNTAPYIQMPKTGIQPRLALGFTIRALLKLMGDEEGLRQTRTLADSLDVDGCEYKGKALAEVLRAKLPVVYSSQRNEPIAYNWKVKFNETGKIPVFYNVFPELNHNEMTGFDVSSSAKPLSEKIHFIFLRDDQDDSRILKRMDATKKIYTDRGFGVEVLELTDGDPWQKIFTSLLIADWAAFYLARYYGADPEQVPMVEEFKKLIA